MPETGKIFLRQAIHHKQLKIEIADHLEFVSFDIICGKH
jgi:hypothetical protein